MFDISVHPSLFYERRLSLADIAHGIMPFLQRFPSAAPIFAAVHLIFCRKTCAGDGMGGHGLFLLCGV